MRVPAAHVVFLLAARSFLAVEKGVREYCLSSAILRDDGVGARFAIAGKPDSGGHESRRESGDGGTNKVEYWDTSGMFRKAFASAHVLVLPTYHPEGIPRVALEASAAVLA